MTNSRTRHPRIGAATLALAVALAGCGDPAAPEVVNTWELVEVAGQALPATVEWAPGSVRRYISDEIRIVDFERWERRQVEQILEPLESAGLRSFESEGTVIDDGAVLILGFECDDTAVCAPPTRLRIVGEREARVELPPGDDDPVIFRYERR